MRTVRVWLGVVVLLVAATTACGERTQAGGSVATAGAGADTEGSAGPEAPGRAAEERVPLRSAYLPLAWTPTELVRGQDLLDERGYEVSWQELSSPNELVQGFAQGQLDVIPQSVGVAANMYAQGVPFTIVDTGMTVYGQVVVPADSPVQAPGDLAGRRVASSTGTSTHAFMVALLEQVHGIDLDVDAEVVNAATPPDQANLLTSGEVDAAIMWSPLAETLTVDGEYRVVARQSELWKAAYPDAEEMIHIIYLARPEYLEQHSGLIEDLQATTQEIVELWESDPARVQELYTQVSDLPPNVIAEAYETGPEPLSGLDRDDIGQITQQFRLLEEVGYFETAPDTSDEALAGLFP